MSDQHGHASKSAGSAGFLERHYHLLRRLHSLSGVFPIGVFLIPHDRRVRRQVRDQEHADREDSAQRVEPAEQVVVALKKAGGTG
ncbi:MAG: hypothetical protein ACKO0W_04040, partial [Planctomycetota bacterium]